MGVGKALFLGLMKSFTFWTSTLELWNEIASFCKGWTWHANEVTAEHWWKGVRVKSSIVEVLLESRWKFSQSQRMWSHLKVEVIGLRHEVIVYGALLRNDAIELVVLVVRQNRVESSYCETKSCCGPGSRNKKPQNNRTQKWIWNICRSKLLTLDNIQFYEDIFSPVYYPDTKNSLFSLN